MKIKIISNGTPKGTEVINVETGEKLEGVIGVRWDIEMGSTGIAVLTVKHVQLEAEAEEVWEQTNAKRI